MEDNSISRTSYIYITIMGSLYCMPRLQFIAYLRMLAAGETPNPGRYGCFAGVPINMTDVTPEQAEEMLVKNGQRV